MAIVVNVGILLVFWRNLPPEVPLLYSRPWGEDQLTSPYFLWMIPILGIVIGSGLGLVTNKIEDKMLRVIFLASNIVIQIVIVLGLVKIILTVI